MDYETYISLKEYSFDNEVDYTLRITDSINTAYYYEGTRLTLDSDMNCIKLQLKQHQN
jgi:hypothetical protein